MEEAQPAASAAGAANATRAAEGIVDNAGQLQLRVCVHGGRPELPNPRQAFFCSGLPSVSSHLAALHHSTSSPSTIHHPPSSPPPASPLLCYGTIRLQQARTRLYNLETQLSFFWAGAAQVMLGVWVCVKVADACPVAAMLAMRRMHGSKVVQSRCQVPRIHLARQEPRKLRPRLHWQVGRTLPGAKRAWTLFRPRSIGHAVRSVSSPGATVTTRRPAQRVRGIGEQCAGNCGSDWTAAER